MTNESEFECLRCGHVSTTKCNLLQHLRRKKPCPAINQLIDVKEYIELLLTKQQSSKEGGKNVDCRFCNKTLSSYQNRHRHEKTCPIRHHDNNQINTLITVIDHLKEEISDIKAKGSGGTSNTNNGTINNNNANVINNITVNGLGKEDIGYLTEHPRFQQFMIKCIKERTDGIMEYLEKKHFDPGHPENHNLKKMKRDDFIEVYDGKKWRLRFKEDVLDDVFEHMQRDFANFVEEAFTENGQLQKRILDHFMKTVGKPLNWDLTCGDYEYEGEIEEEQRQQLQTRIYKLALEHIYKKSKEMHDAIV